MNYLCASWLSGGILVTILVEQFHYVLKTSGRVSKGHRRLLYSAEGSARRLSFVFLKSLTQRKKDEAAWLCADLFYLSLGGTLIKVMQKKKNQLRTLHSGLFRTIFQWCITSRLWSFSLINLNNYIAIVKCAVCGAVVEGSLIWMGYNQF